jgi:hypothetical protein
MLIRRWESKGSFVPGFLLEEANESLDIVNTNLGDRAIREVRDEMPFDDPLVVILRTAREPRAPIVEPPSGLLGEGGGWIAGRACRGREDASLGPVWEPHRVVEGARRHFTVDLSELLLEVRTVSGRVSLSGPLAAANAFPTEIQEEPAVI